MIYDGESDEWMDEWMDDGGSEYKKYTTLALNPQ